MHYRGISAKIFVKCLDEANKSDSFREILRSRPGLRMTDLNFHSIFPLSVKPCRDTLLLSQRLFDCHFLMQECSESACIILALSFGDLAVQLAFATLHFAPTQCLDRGLD
jgi:hypothetical protein